MEVQQIRPVTDLRNKVTEITREVVEEQRPVILTKNGRGHMVLLSFEEYSRLTDLRELYAAVDAGLADVKAGRTRDAKAFFAELKEDVAHVKI